MKTGGLQDGVINYIPIIYIHAKTPKSGTSLYSKVPTHTFIIIKIPYILLYIEISYNIVITAATFRVVGVPAITYIILSTF